MPTYVTPAGLEKLEAEVIALNKQKIELGREVETARQHGDLKENAEYHAAKERLTQVVQKLNQTKMKLADVRVIDPKDQDTSMVVLGVQVTVKDLKTGDEDTYQMLGPDEADPLEGKLSIKSPLGQAFLGKKEGDETVATLPAGDRAFKIVKIEAIP